MLLANLEHDKVLSIPLTTCDREAIHLLGSIQPVGFLIGISKEMVVLRVSENIQAYLGRSSQALLGANLRDVLNAEALHAIHNHIAMIRGPAAVERVFGLKLQDHGSPVDLALYVSGSSIVLEGERSEPQADMTAGVLVRSMIARLEQASNFVDLTNEAARQVRAMTGFDRVMVYRFHPDGSGEVIAESMSGRLEPYLGLRYPSTDIPRQARALFERSLLRLIADVDAAPVPIVPELDGDGQPLDLSSSGLRTVSPLHLQYLRNMGVQASMAISIVRRGKLWGMIACHHGAARHVGLERRTAAELFVQMFALLIESREREEDVAYQVRTRLMHNQVLAAISEEASVADNIAALADKMSELLPCDGIGVWLDGHATLKGAAPDSAAFAGLANFLNLAAADQAYANAEIGQAYEAAGAWSERAVGVLAIPISRLPGDYLIFFRKELARKVIWAGRPEKPVPMAGNDSRLTPRESFKAWQEIVRGQSAPWTEAEQHAAEALRITLLDVVLRLTNVADGERRMVERKQDLLIGELNHRVRNILGLVNGLVSQGRATAEDVGTFSEVLGGRVQALARAHNQITADNWGPASLGSLVATEAEPYVSSRPDSLRITGPSILLKPEAFTTLALVIHELLTNSAKYGALSAVAGQVAIDWSADSSGDLTIAWSETGGPPVRAPTRRGFGSTIIERSVPHELKGEANVEYLVEGLKARFTLPAEYVVQGQPDAPPSDDRSAFKIATRLSGTVLLVEDSMIIALDAEQMLISLGASRVDVASSTEDAMRLIDRETPTFAVVDVNLGRETSFTIASRLRELGVPLVFATGYGDDIAFPVGLSDVSIVKKPYTADSIARAARL
jgi:light-regulated signal transduction histidine kinase (bacteriophytochrome)/CheY-like chemotaxis protein